MQAILSRLGHAEAHVRRDAVAALQHLSEKGDELALSAMMPLLSDPDAHVREAVAATVRVVAKKGDQRALDAILPLVNDSHAGVRVQAIVAVRELAVRGDAKAVEAVANRLEPEEDPDSTVRQQAVQALKAIANRGCDRSISAVASRLEDQDSVSRRVAIVALSSLAEKGDVHVINMVLPWLEDESHKIRRKAFDTLAVLALKGDPQSLSAAIKGLQDSNHKVATSASYVIGTVALQGDETVLVALRKALTHEHKQVRVAAVAALGLVAVPGDRESTDAVASLLEDVSENTRIEATSALQALARPGKGNRRVVKSLVGRIQHQDPMVRQAIVGALGSIAERGNDVATTALESVLETDTDADVWWMAVQALMGLTTPEEGRLSNTVARRLNDPAVTMRRLAVSALKELAEQGCKNSAFALTEMAVAHLEDSDSFVRYEALQSLSDLGRIGGAAWTAARAQMTRVVVAVASRLGDDDAEVREAAIATMCMWSKGDWTGDCSPATGAAVSAECMAEAVKRLADARPEIRVVALGAIESLLPLTDAKIDLAPLLKGLADPDPDVRAAGLSAAGVAIKGLTDSADVSVIRDQIVTLLASDPATEVRCAALDALAASTEANDAASCASIVVAASALEDSEPDVRAAAAEAMCTLSQGEGGCARGFAVDAVAARLNHADAGVRKGAVEALRELGAAEDTLNSKSPRDKEHLKWPQQPPVVRVPSDDTIQSGELSPCTAEHAKAVEVLMAHLGDADPQVSRSVRPEQHSLGFVRATDVGS